MANKMSKIYLGKIVEVIQDENGNPTLELKVRVPTIHGSSTKSGIKDNQLPIARPMEMPGLEYNKDSFNDLVENKNTVYVIFSQGDYDRPVYFGLTGVSGNYEAKADTTYIIAYDDTTKFPEVGKVSYLYRARDTNEIYYWDSTEASYKTLVGSEALPYATATTKGAIRVEVVNKTAYIYTSDDIPE